MKFSIGYNPSLPYERYQNYFNEQKIDEIYFSVPGIPSGHDMSMCYTQSFDEIKRTLLDFSENGKKLNLLLNASCYGKMEGTSEQDNYIYSIMKKLEDSNLHIDIVTVVSPYMAKTIKRNYPNIEIRMSVLSCIQSIQSMILASDIFDSFYINQDLNRNINIITKFSNWCKQNSKKLCIVVNSGCLGSCPYKMSHGNISSHCYERSEYVRIPCSSIYSNASANRVLHFLQGNWIRPEDIHNYKNIIDIGKIDTRLQTMTFNHTIDSYINEKCIGNLFDIMSQTSPYTINIDNQKFPLNYFDNIKKCTKECDKCMYCQTISTFFNE